MSDSLSTKYIEIQNVEQTFKTKKGPFCALKNINLIVAKGEFVALIGHSGCGKSTLLNLIAGLTTPTEGSLLCANREIAGPGPERAVVFQNHSLLPWLTCFENVYLAVERVFSGTEDKTQSTFVMVTHDVDEAVLLSDRIVMMTNGPSAKFGEILSKDLARPRNRVALAESTQYLGYRKAVIDFLYTRQAHVEKLTA